MTGEMISKEIDFQIEFHLANKSSCWQEINQFNKVKFVASVIITMVWLI